MDGSRFAGTEGRTRKDAHYSGDSEPSKNQQENSTEFFHEVCPRCMNRENSQKKTYPPGGTINLTEERCSKRKNLTIGRAHHAKREGEEEGKPQHLIEQMLVPGRWRFQSLSQGASMYRDGECKINHCNPRQGDVREGEIERPYGRSTPYDGQFRSPRTGDKKVDGVAETGEKDKDLNGVFESFP